MPKLETDWSGPIVTPITFAIGSEHFLAARALKIFRDSLQSKHPGLEVTEVLEGELTPGTVLDLAAPSLFQEPRLITVQNPGEQVIAELKEFEAANTEDAYVWARISGSPALVGKLRKEFGHVAQFVLCDELKSEGQRISFARAELTAAGKQVDADALRLLVNAFSSDLGELAGACAQIGSHPQPRIDGRLIEEIFGGRVETTVFKIADAAFAGNAADAIRLLRHALNTGADPVMMVGAFANRVRQLGRLVSNPRTPAEALGLQPWMLDRVRKDMAGWSESELVKLLRRVADADAATKGASRDPEFVLEKLLLAIANKRG